MKVSTIKLVMQDGEVVLLNKSEGVVVFNEEDKDVITLMNKNTKMEYFSIASDKVKSMDMCENEEINKILEKNIKQKEEIKNEEIKNEIDEEDDEETSQEKITQNKTPDEIFSDDEEE